jgi:hypothetical protein
MNWWAILNPKKLTLLRGKISFFRIKKLFWQRVFNFLLSSPVGWIWHHFFLKRWLPAIIGPVPLANSTLDN